MDECLNCHGAGLNNFASSGLAPACCGQLDLETQPRTGTLCWFRGKSPCPREPTYDVLEGLQHKQNSSTGTEWICSRGRCISSAREVTTAVGLSFSNQHEMEIP